MSLLAYGYVRVSTSKQDLSPPAQRAAIEQLAGAAGAEVEYRYEQPTSAATLERRPIMMRVLRDLTEGRHGLLLAARLDRVTRSVRDAATLIEHSTEHGWVLRTTEYQLDSRTAMGEFILYQMIAFAQLERRLIGERTSAAMQVMRDQGHLVGRPQSIPDEVVLGMVAKRDQGLSFSAIARELNVTGVPTARGGASWAPSTVSRAIKRYERSAFRVP